ncbi:DoxX family membrane protein [Candidatus Nomurabacteria bacterium]|nr:DoxX family membrane protein [Candidatus Nomurabacteria bacterium]MCB9820603.1 DoxX family membrane protein [Candidatus Nomurabacteria bacterium]
MDFINKYSKYYFLVGKLLVVGVFIYFGLDGIFNPSTFSYLIPSFVSNIMSADFVVMIHGGIEVACGLMILLNLGKAWPYVILILSFIGVLFTVSGTVLVRDIGIFGGMLLLLSSQHAASCEKC